MTDAARPGMREVLAVWALFLLVAVEVLVTYARLPAGDLFNVSGSGLEGGASRALVFLGYPMSLAVIAILPVLVERLAHPAASGAALLALALCATVAFPGVVDQSDLDARPVNALAGIGVAIALVLTAVALARGGVGESISFGGCDRARVALAVVLLLAAVPWLVAEIGYHVGGPVFLSDEIRPEPGHPDLTAVHLGHHHGMDGVLLAWSGLLLSRVLGGGGVRRRGLRRALALYLSLMLVYGLANALQDFWLEQIVKRGTLSRGLPSMLRPELSPAWAGILAAAALIYLASYLVDRVDKAPRRRIS